MLKIDEPFIDGLGRAASRTRLAAAIVRLGATLRLETVAEGIEEPSSCDVLRELGCELGQGYLFARPVPAVDLEPLLRRALVA